MSEPFIPSREIVKLNWAMEVWGVFWLWCIWNNSQGIGVHPWSRAYFLPFQLMSSNFLSYDFFLIFYIIFTSLNLLSIPFQPTTITLTDKQHSSASPGKARQFETILNQVQSAKWSASTFEQHFSTTSSSILSGASILARPLRDKWALVWLSSTTKIGD